MAVTTDDLLEAIETGGLLYPEVPGQMSLLPIPGVLARTSSASHFFTNAVGAATLTPDDADRAIAQVREHFAREAKTFGWFVGPRSRPADLGERLTAAGLQRRADLSMAGMALTDLSVPVRTNPEVEVRQEGRAALDDASAAMGRWMFDTPADVMRLFNASATQPDAKVRVRAYLAYLAGRPKPVGFGFMLYMPRTPVVLLGGAAVDPEARRRGVYHTLVARRLADARADGYEAAVIQAVRTTSAPRCRQVGFREVCGLELYVWSPPPA
jgi:GNAT superfamily N-acetyltransferase